VPVTLDGAFLRQLMEICGSVWGQIKIYKTIILPVVLYGCETWYLTLREEHRLRVFENRVQRRLFGPNRDEVTGEWRKLQNEELHNLYSSPDIIRQVKSRRMRWAGHVARMGEERKVYRVLAEKLKGKGPLGRMESEWILGRLAEVYSVIQLVKERERETSGGLL
jgi:hypothetical protein